MCLICKRHKREEEETKSKAGKYQSGTREYVNFRLGDQKEQFERVKTRIGRKMGTKVSASQCVRHCIAFTDQYLEDEISMK